MYTNLKLKTSFVSPANLEALTNAGWLPVFIIRNIQNSKLIGKYSRTPVHYFWLAPSSDLFHKKRDGEISIDDFKKRYLTEVVNNINIEETLEKLYNLQRLSGSKGIVLMSYGSSFEDCHRSILAKLINQLGYLEEPVNEIVI